MAHIYLSFDHDMITVGNVIADFVKGNKFNDYERGIKNGILIHREIDSYTDQHSIFLQGKRRLSEYRHYSGVIMDMFYDHFLSKNWHEYSDEPLQDFTKRNYQLFLKHEHIIPEQANYLIHHMQKGDWLYNYQRIEGIQFALTGLSRRTKFKSGMELATKNLQEDYLLLEEEFRAFFKDITDHIHNFTAQLVKE
ncbi:MAG: acyl carrier protein phosphodiesterase [Reichenbachiella sp.]